MAKRGLLGLCHRLTEWCQALRRFIVSQSPDWLALLIFLMATVLRLYNLTAKSLRQDEIITYRYAHLDLNTLATDASAISSWSPFLYIKTHFFLLLGDSEFWLRLPSVIEGVLAVALIYLLGKTLWDRRTGLVAAVLLATNHYHIWWTQDARYYALQWMLTLLATYCLWQGVQVNRPKYWLGFAGAVALSLYNHPSGLFMLGSLGLLGVGLLTFRGVEWGWHGYRLGKRKARTDQPLGAGIVAIKEPKARQVARFFRKVMGSRLVWLALSLLLILALDKRFFAATYRDVMDPVGKGNIGGFSSPVSTVSSSDVQAMAVSNSLPGSGIRIGASQTLDSTFLKKLFAAYGTGPGWYLDICLFFAGLGLLSCLWQRYWKHLLLALCFFTVPFFMLALTKVDRNLTPNHLSCLLPAYVLWIAAGVCSFKWKGPLTLVPVLCVLLLVGLGASQLQVYYRVEKQNWRDVALLLKERVRPGEVVIGHSSDLQFYQPELEVHKEPSDWDSFLSTYDGVWYVSLNVERSTQFRQWLYDTGFATITTNGRWGRVLVSYWRRDALRAQLQDDLTLAAVSMFPDDALLQRDRGNQHYYRRNKPEEVDRAIRRYEAAIRLDPYLDTYAGGLASNTHGRLIELYHMRQQIEAAAALCRKAVFAYPDQHWPFAAWIETYARVKRFEDARSAFRWGVLLWPHVPEIYDALGRFLADAGETDAALGIYQQARRHNRDHAWPHLRLADVYLGTQDSQAAVQAYQQAIRVEPTFPESYKLLSRWYLSSGEKDKAVAVYQDAITRNPDWAWLYDALADLYVEMGQPTRAIAEYRRAGFRQPQYAAYFESKLGTVRWSLAEQLSTLPLVYARASDARMVWWPTTGAWVKPAPYPSDVIVGRSDLPVEDVVLPDQVLLHPFEPDEPTRVTFKVSDNPYATLETSFGLADQVSDKSNGVGYEVEISQDGGGTFTSLVSAVVTQSAWVSSTVSLFQYQGQDVTFRLTVDPLGAYDYDWLQVTFDLLPDQ